VILLAQHVRVQCDGEGCINIVEARLALRSDGGFQVALGPATWQVFLMRDGGPVRVFCPDHPQKAAEPSRIVTGAAPPPLFGR
jgi:hypothetical protein